MSPKRGGDVDGPFGVSYWSDRVSCRLRRQIQRGSVCTLIGVAAVTASLPGYGSGPELAREAKSLKAVCSHCHNLEIVTDTPRSYDDWQDTVQKMVDHGAHGTDTQFDEIMDLLHRTLTTINVNTADAGELQTVLGVSEATAANIIARRALRRLTSLEDLKTVEGIDPARLDSKARLIFFR